MKKLIPFKKEIKFKDNIYEVTSISLEHSLHKDNNTISGNFTVSGEYRVTEESANTLPFTYDLPFNIEMDDKYDISKSSIDINDFYYEIVDNKILEVNIEVKLDHVDEILIERNDNVDIDINNIEIDNNIDKTIDNSYIDVNNDIDITKNIVDTPIASKTIEVKPDSIDTNDVAKSLFSSLDTSDNYVTYRVYIVRENDTLETIMNKYNVTSDTLELYNDIKDIKLGDKIIIPYVKNN